MNHQTITLKIHNDDVIRLAKSKFAFIVARHMSKYNNAADKLVENFDKIDPEELSEDLLDDLLTVFEETIEELKTLKPMIKKD